jgi:hypothetical protein
MMVWTLLVLSLIVSVGWAEDPDYSNVPENAGTIPTDGTFVQGYLASGDEDWFKFTPAENTLYRVTLNGEVSKGYKEMRIYQIDEFGNLHETIYHYAWSNGVSVRTFFIEDGADIYIKMYSNVGSYSFYIETLAQYPPDSYSDTCEDASAVTVDAAPISATLTHLPDGSLETDWFVFDTQPPYVSDQSD